MRLGLVAQRMGYCVKDSRLRFLVVQGTSDSLCAVTCTYLRDTRPAAGTT